MYKEGYIRGYSGVKIFYRAWTAKDPSHFIFFIHGLTGHSGKYIEFGKYLIDNDINVFMIDLRGHGKSGGKRGDIGSFETYLLDVKQMLSFIEKNYKLEKLFLSGHSMGGLISIAYILNYRDCDIEGLILSAPGLKIGIDVNPFLKKLIYLIPKNLLIGYVDSHINPELQTRDEDKRRVFYRDKLILRKISLRLVRELFKTSEEVFARAEEVRKPLLIFIGTGDRLVDPMGIKEFFERVKVEDKELVEMEGGLHEIFNDLYREKAYRKFVEWVLKH